MTQQAGLRERKKQATRAALSRAAWVQACENGVDAVSAESVAEAVGVSERTFRNYFGSREEAIVEAVVHHVEVMAEALRGRPTGESVWDSLAAVLPETVSGMVTDQEDVNALLRLSRNNPAVLAQQLASYERVHRLLEQALAERTGSLDLATKLVAGAARVAVQTSIETWAAEDCRTSLAVIVGEALAQLRRGIPMASPGDSGTHRTGGGGS
ncbi:TetR/AcrR family transcriptional regulator [Streptomyces sp. NPDC090499]|uniref:TetR/AcrR family transcriptional regulator n=1 Tax=Streptomyces sp. NPDC090499 TaxID=3365965 RepID=UPI0038066642